MRLFDLVEEHDRKRLLPYGVCQFAAGVVAKIARRRADKPLVRVLEREFAHVEADICAFIAEQEAGDGLREFGLADASRPSEKRHTARAPAAFAAEARRRALHDVEHVAYGVGLALDTRRDERLGLLKPLTIDPAPRVFRHPKFVAPHGLRRVSRPQSL